MESAKDVGTFGGILTCSARDVGSPRRRVRRGKGMSSQQLLREGTVGMRTMSRTCWKTLLEPGKAFAETCVAGILFGHLSTGSLMWRWRWVVNDGERATLVHVPNPAREELCAIFCDGLEEMLDGDDTWSKIAQCAHTHWLLLGAVPKGVCGRG